MAKLLVERPRVGGGKQRRIRREDPISEEAPRRESLKGGYAFRKCLNENLAPLRRFLQSRCGRPWDGVYSELREHVRFDSTIQYHILQHLWDYVVRHVVILDGVPCYANHEGWGSGYGVPLGQNRSMQFYVHPESGLLLQVKKPRRQRGPRPPRHRPTPPQPRLLPDGRQLHRLRGVWCYVVVQRLSQELPPGLDVVLGIGLSLLWAHQADLKRTYGRPGVYGASATPLTPRQLRKMGLLETPQDRTD